jgi:hypothetical protein
MTRSSLLWTALFSVGCISAVSYATSTSVYSPEITAQAQTTNQAPAEQTSDIEWSSQNIENDSLNTVTVPSPQKSVAKLIAEANAEDPTTRAAAIDALAAAPKARAAPVLQALLSASASEDRQLALNSLHTLALNQGDDDGAIRSVFRNAIYDGDDGELAVNAQLALDELDRDLGQVESTPTR